MKTILSIIHIVILGILGFTALALLFNEEFDADTTAFIIHVIIDKLIAMAAFILFVILYNRWKKTDPWLMSYDNYVTMDSELRDCYADPDEDE